MSQLSIISDLHDSLRRTKVQKVAEEIAHSLLLCAKCLLGEQPPLGTSAAPQGIKRYPGNFKAHLVRQTSIASRDCVLVAIDRCPGRLEPPAKVKVDLDRPVIQ